MGGNAVGFLMSMRLLRRLTFILTQTESVSTSDLKFREASMKKRRLRKTCRIVRACEGQLYIVSGKDRTDGEVILK
jgi:hypothetical protein